MFIPNMSCTISKRTGHDSWGKPTYSSPAPAQCAIIKLTEAREKTSVRTDSSASRGNAEEIKSDARLLFTASTVISKSDIVTILGFRVSVTSVFPRIAVDGRLDHWQIDAEIESS